MERRILQPDQIIVPGEYELGNESILKIYFRMFERGHGADLPPAIVTTVNVIPEKERNSLYVGSMLDCFRVLKGRYGGHIPSFDEQDTEESLLSKMQQVVNIKYAGLAFAANGFYQAFLKFRNDRDQFEKKVMTANYCLLDGNHKSAAATLSHSSIYALELQTDEDLGEVRKMIENGELFDFKRLETSLTDLVKSYITYIIGDPRSEASHIDDLRTIRERIDELTSNGDLPNYMKERYLMGK